MALANHEPKPNPGKGEFSPVAPGARYDGAARTNAQHRGATHQYQRAQVESASPTRLIVLLYEGAVRFCSLAQDAMRKKDLEAQNLNLIRAQRIIAELLASLNRTAGGEVALNLARIYTHLLAELVRANLYDDIDALSNVITLLTEMRASWIEIDRLQTGDTEVHDAAPADVSAGSKAPIKRIGSHSGSHATALASRSPHSAAAHKSVPSAPFRLEDRLA